MHHHPLTGRPTKLYCLATETHVCEQLAQGCYLKARDRESNTRPSVSQVQRPNPTPPGHAYAIVTSLHTGARARTVSQRNNKTVSVLFFSRPRSQGWPHHGRRAYFLHLILSSVILTDSSTGSPVQVLMLSIQAVCGLHRLRAPGIVPCIISFSRQIPCFLMV